MRSFDVVAPTKQKGDMAELRVASDLVRQGFQIAIPFGEDCDFDLVLIRDERFERVQVKYTESDGRVVEVRCSSQSLTNGKVRSTKRYTEASVDWLAAYDATSDRCFLRSSALAGQWSLQAQPAAETCPEQPDSRDALGRRLRLSGEWS